MPIVRDDGYETTEEASEKLKFNFSISSFFFWKFIINEFVQIFPIIETFISLSIFRENRTIIKILFSKNLLAALPINFDRLKNKINLS